MYLSLIHIFGGGTQRGGYPADGCPLHVASALVAGATELLTTDKMLLKKMQRDSRLRVMDPIDFIRFLQENEHEN